MKKSRAIPLVMLGTLGALAGCSPAPDYDDVPVRQHSYRSQEDCRKDWGTDDRDCTRSGGGYVGPRYIYSHSGGYPMAVMPDGSTRQLPNTYLSRPGATSTAVSAVQSTMTVARGTPVSTAGARAGVSTASSRGGFGASAHGGSTGG